MLSPFAEDEGLRRGGSRRARLRRRRANRRRPHKEGTSEVRAGHDDPDAGHEVHRQLRPWAKMVTACRPLSEKIESLSVNGMRPTFCDPRKNGSRDLRLQGFQRRPDRREPRREALEVDLQAHRRVAPMLGLTQSI